jgi:2-keto-4-pentenoate hydratase/2-oxohepta-3-ene-1,7-dioic acid hydratase in catechol pathway
MTVRVRFCPSPTGTPDGVGPLEHGDTVSITIEGIGTLTNPVVRKGKS